MVVGDVSVNGTVILCNESGLQSACPANIPVFGIFIAMQQYHKKEQPFDKAHPQF